MPSSGVRRFTDPDKYVAAVRATTAEVSITKPGHFSAELIRIDLHRLWMQRFSETLPRIAYTSDAPGRAIISFRTQPGQPTLSGGLEMPFYSIKRHGDGHSVFHRTATAAQTAAMSLPIADMEALGASFGGADFTPPRDPVIFAPPATAMERLLRLHYAAGQLAENAPEVIANPEAARGLEQALIFAMADCLIGPNDRQAKSGNRRPERIMRQFYVILADNPGVVLHTTDMCKALGISNRTLTTCSHDALGMSPHRFLRLRQMHLAHRALARQSRSGNRDGYRHRHGARFLGPGTIRDRTPGVVRRAAVGDPATRTLSGADCPNLAHIYFASFRNYVVRRHAMAQFPRSGGLGDIERHGGNAGEFDRQLC